MENNEELELINKLARKKLTYDDVYIFPVTLCDNEIDRDHEAFSAKTLDELSALFVGKTGISDHSLRSSDQSARIFKTWVEEHPDRLTSYGEKYTALKAKAYMVRTKKNEDLIREIDAGIKKEVSVGCCVKGHTCSICGKEKCLHIRGKVYNGKLCYTVLSQASDAYEWSFVAVPAQREAGVTKAYQNKERKNTMNTAEIIKSAFSDRDERTDVCEYISRLEKEAEDGRRYKAELSLEVNKLFCIAVPELSQKAVSHICESLDTQALSELRASLLKKKSTLFPCTPQTVGKSERIEKNTENEYMI